MSDPKDLKAMTPAEYRALRTQTLRDVAKQQSDDTAARVIGRMLTNLTNKHGTNQPPNKKG